MKWLLLGARGSWGSMVPSHLYHGSDDARAQCVTNNEDQRQLSPVACRAQPWRKSAANVAKLLRRPRFLATWKPPPRALASGLPHAAVRKTLQTLPKPLRRPRFLRFAATWKPPSRALASGLPCAAVHKAQGCDNTAQATIWGDFRPFGRLPAEAGKS